MVSSCLDPLVGKDPDLIVQLLDLTALSLASEAGIGAQSLLRDADAALYQAKRARPDPPGVDPITLTR